MKMVLLSTIAAALFLAPALNEQAPWKAVSAYSYIGTNVEPL